MEITNLEQAQAADWSSTVVYEGVLPNVDLEYIVEYDYIKENIIVNAPSAAYEYAFTLELNGMYAELLGDGSVGIYCRETEEEKYTIPAPYMYDANGKLSLDVAYTLTGTAGNYTLTVNADASWINRQDRTFPVTIDPSFVVSTGVPFDTYIDANHPTTNYGASSTLWVSEDQIVYIDPVSDITLPLGATLDYAALTVFYFYPDGAEACGVDVGAYQVTSLWGESTATWNSMSALTNFGMSTTCSTWETADSEVGATISAPKQLDFFITDIMENWMEGDAQRGVALKYECGDGLDVGFLSYEAGYDYRPGITYRYYIDSVALTASSTRQLSTGHRYTFTFTPTATDKYSFWTTGSANTTISLYSDDSSSSLIEQKTTGGHSANACLTERLTAGTTYHLAVQGTGSASTPFSFKVYRGLPLSGSEQPARLSEFNSEAYQENTNCYTYALNLLEDPVEEMPFRPNGQKPGEMAGAEIDITTYNDLASAKAAVENAVRADLAYIANQPNYDATNDFLEIGEEEMAPEGYYKVLLVLCQGEEGYYEDFHWYRQTSDLAGGWAHKFSTAPARTTDDLNNPIYVPSEASWNDYTILVGYYAVKLPD